MNVIGFCGLMAGIVHAALGPTIGFLTVGFDTSGH
jgi:hypothetical protein